MSKNSKSVRRFTAALFAVVVLGGMADPGHAQVVKYPGYADGVATMSLAQARDGRHLIGAIGSLGGETDFAVARFSSSGYLDRAFGVEGFSKPFTDRHPDRQAQAKNVAVSPDGRIAVVGLRKSTSHAGAMQRYRAPAIAMLRPDGEPVKHFGDGGTLTWGYFRRDEAYMDAVFQSRRRLVVIGAKNPARVYEQGATVTAFLPSGELDGAFGNEGRLTIMSSRNATSEGSGLTNFESVALLPDGRLVASGYLSGRPSVVRLTRNGRLDRSFGDGGIVTAGPSVECAICGEDVLTDVAIGPRGSVILKNELLGGAITLQKFTSNGTVVKKFGRRGLVKTTPAEAQPAFAEFVDPSYKPVRAFAFGGMVVSGRGQITVATTGMGIDGTKDRDWYFRSVLIGYKRNGELDRRFGRNGFAVRERGRAGATGQPLIAGGKVWTGGVISVDGEDHLDLWPEWRR